MIRLFFLSLSIKLFSQNQSNIENKKRIEYLYNHQDWKQLIKVCSAKNTFVISVSALYGAIFSNDFDKNVTKNINDTIINNLSFFTHYSYSNQIHYYINNHSTSNNQLMSYQRFMGGLKYNF